LFDGSVNYVKLDNWYDDVMATNRNRLWCYPKTSNGGEVKPKLVSGMEFVFNRRLVGWRGLSRVELN